MTPCRRDEEAWFVYQRGMGKVLRLLAVLAIAAYAANGALAHLVPGGSQVIHVGICGPGGGELAVDLGSSPAEETGDTCCGLCLVAPVLPAEAPVRMLVGLAREPAPLPLDVPAVSPRLPLWPGAPPQGPPRVRKA
ncbi:MAG: hypothetical protein AAF253_00415 [Pseudomonadota bacterium]